MRVLVLAIVVLACAARLAHAAGPSVSYSTWIVSGDTVMLRFVLPVAQAERLTGAAVPVLTVSKLGDYILSHTAVSAAGRDCPAIDQGYDLGKVDPVRVGPGLYGFEILFRCSAPVSSLVLVDHALFDRVPRHVDFARIEAGRRFTDQLFTAGSPRVHIADVAAVPAAGLGRYMSLGLWHVLSDLARLCFLVAAVLAVGRPREIPLVLAGLAAGYVLALAAQGSGLVAFEGPLIEAFIGFLVALSAAAVIAPRLGGPGLRPGIGPGHAPGIPPARPAIPPGLAIAGWPLLLLALAIIAAVLHASQPALLLAGAALLSAGFNTAVRNGMPRGIMALPAGIFGFVDGFALPSLLAPLGLGFPARVRMSIGYDLGALLAEALVLALAAAALALAGGRLLPERRRGPDRGTPRPGGLIAPAPAPALPLLRGTLIEIVAAAVFAGLGTFWLVSRLHP